MRGRGARHSARGILHADGACLSLARSLSLSLSLALTPLANCDESSPPGCRSARVGVLCVADQDRRDTVAVLSVISDADGVEAVYVADADVVGVQRDSRRVLSVSDTDGLGLPCATKTEVGHCPGGRIGHELVNELGMTYILLFIGTRFSNLYT